MTEMNDICGVPDGDPTGALNQSNEATMVTDLQLWFGVMGGAIAWLFHLLLSYGISEFGCVSGFRERQLLGITGVAWLEIAVTVLSLALALGATLVAHRSKRQFARLIDSARLEANDPRVFMARSGVMASGLFVFIILVQALPVLYYLREC